MGPRLRGDDRGDDGTQGWKSDEGTGDGGLDGLATSNGTTFAKGTQDCEK